MVFMNRLYVCLTSVIFWPGIDLESNKNDDGIDDGSEVKSLKNFN